jgi:phage baseplate assembly protein W
VADWETTDEGELVLSGGNFVIASNEQSVRQEILFRLQTELFGYAPDPELGAGLDQFIGKPNNRTLGSRANRAVTRALTRDDRFTPNDIRVEVVPLGIHEVGIYVFVSPAFTGSFSPITVAVSIDLTVGSITTITG